MDIQNNLSIGRDHQSIAQKVYLKIKSLILDGTLPEGTPISEVELATLLDVSRTPVREALKELSHQGLILNSSRKRAVVAAIDEEDARAIALVRITMEKLACSLLLERGILKIDFGKLERLAQRCFSHYEAGNLAEAVESDSLFHLELARQSGNMHLYELLVVFDPKIQLLRLRQNLPLERKLKFATQHKEMISLLRSGDHEKLCHVLDQHIEHDF